MLFGTYDPQKVTVTVGNITVIGYADGTFVKAFRNEELFTYVPSADGHGTRVRNANRSGRVEITLKGSSPSNNALQALAIQDELNGTGVKPVFIKDNSGSGLAQGQNGWIIKIPDLERAKELGDVTWIIETDLILPQQGGTTPIPGTT